MVVLQPTNINITNNLNLSDFGFQGNGTLASDITQGCMEFCADQHFLYQNRFTWLIVLALLLLIIAKLLYNNLELLINKTPYSEEQISLVIIRLNEAAMWLLILYVLVNMFFGYDLQYEKYNQLRGL